MSPFLSVPPRSGPAVLRVARLAAAALVLAVLGCESNVVAPTPATDARQLYWELTLDHRAITLSTTAPYDTITLRATPLNGVGEPLAGLPAPIFRSTDLDRLTVSHDGVVQGFAPGTQIMVIATLTANNATHADTAYVNVVDDPAPPVMVSFSATPEPPDSAKDALGGDPFLGPKALPVRALDGAGAPINGIAVYFTSSDPSLAEIDRLTGIINARRPGPVTFYASATAFGVRMADTIPFTIGHSLVGLVQIVPSPADSSVTRFDVTEIRIGVGGYVAWFNLTGVETDVTFNDPTHVAEHPMLCGFLGLCGSGNIEPYGPPAGDPEIARYVRARQFPVPGEYPFRSTLFGATGKVVVVDERAPSAARVGR